MSEKQSAGEQPSPAQCEGYATRASVDNSGAALFAVRTPAGAVHTLRFTAEGRADPASPFPLGVTSATLTREGDRLCAQTQGAADPCLRALGGELCANVVAK